MTTLLTRQDYFNWPDFPLAVARREPQPVFVRHRHQFVELLIITGGSAAHMIDDRSFPVAVGDVFVIGGQQEHEFRDMKNLALVNILFDPAGLGMPDWPTADLPGFRALFRLEPEYRGSHRFESRLVVSGQDLHRTEELVAKLENELQQRTAGFRLAAISHFMELLTHLARCYGQTPTPQSQSLLRIAEAINYLERHFNETIDFPELSRIAHMSVRNFQRVFQRTMHCSAHDYVLTLRLRQAQRLLHGSDQPISQIAYACGFSDSNYFARQFRRYAGCSPSHYRQH